MVELATLFGWRVYHSRPAWIRDGRMITALQGHAGFPDVIMVRSPRQIVAELKNDKGVLTIAQERWLDVFAACAVETYLWRPSHLQEVARILDRRLQCRPGDWITTSWPGSLVRNVLEPDPGLQRYARSPRPAK